MKHSLHASIMECIRQFDAAQMYKLECLNRQIEEIECALEGI